ncbi:MAG: tRNA (adenosine(37)-N6)-threonylcarbamoyltransferase complex transferase subunit TsaD [Omnitrophica WOR_2 bacterium GWF2_38_59]|nr:MAG: tRNA (adenosine(37)-N6)-threonylcarbamoyltransferase complex transferase subunit TsaD [Omnitrophica WOR_2 bacterium GWA2_37_7]OGX24993.1 MAG: tRNA (adenosine(37)-N6)-threonylcarbamoyltransferase complex transferase subunit TsaD [Omnitrophica WOR_2 bacterium GWF2_38_59]OGX48427.1 MAG: tRNA (adenosine(37)-N6)-threonylcarbamoyltransferase complex transferase subunit TsaD [Omnitrophica WOR_2 bacterium RIFOXYA2_FULL_38_17]OGX53010.1 MAG: tRNA (adenosine(37)-N6)-threonylcarbamoyltransferase co
MNILGIETSCDETAASVVKNGKVILSNVVVSSLKEHKKYGGIIPEIASRRQLECIYPIVEKALSDASMDLKKIDAVAVTKSPGLIGSLLVGISFAKALSFAIKKPLIEIDHIKAHLYSSFLSNKANSILPKLPAIGLVVSGGHTSLYQITSFNRFKLLGETLDDAAGEAYDKVARILELGYPGGPAIDKIADSNSSSSIKFNPAELPGTLNFSFSGVKTAVLYHTRKFKRLSKTQIKETVTAFQDSVVSILVKKSIAACQRTKIKTLVIGGGVAANSQLRKVMIDEANKDKIKVFFPEMSLCADNAAMIAGLGYHIYRE